MTKIELAYIAGFFDGEGSVYVTSYRATRNGKLYPKLCASLTQVDIRVLEWVKLNFGGCVSVDSHKDRQKVCHRWATSHQKALTFLNAIRPYLRIKHDKVDALIQQIYG